MIWRKLALCIFLPPPPLSSFLHSSGPSMYPQPCVHPQFSMHCTFCSCEVSVGSMPCPSLMLPVCTGLGGGLVLSLIWMVVVRLFCGLMVWVSVWLANLCFIACTIFSYAKAGDVSATSKLGEVTDPCIMHYCEMYGHASTPADGLHSSSKQCAGGCRRDAR